MLKSIKNAGLEARLSHEVYTDYSIEIASLEAKWKESLEMFDFPGMEILGGINTRFIPSPINQDDSPNLIYDYRNCRYLKKGEALPAGFKTMAGGGNIPCIIKCILEYFGRNVPLEQIGRLLVQHGYRTPDDGTLWSSFERLLEPIYGIKVTVPSSLYELIGPILLGQPVIAMIDAEHVYKQYQKYFSREIHGRMAIIIWQFTGGHALISCTHLYGLHSIKLEDLFPNLYRAWVCKKK